jgi:hypothetical protein
MNDWLKKKEVMTEKKRERGKRTEGFELQPSFGEES